MKTNIGGNSQRFRHKPEASNRWRTLAWCSLGFLILAPGPVAAETPIGPGVAGQIHALAYDPTNPETIYAGGDNCGVYRSLNHGETWQRWNEGLADANPRMTSYVDDLLVIPSSTPGIDPIHAGVYASTRGGIAFRQENSSVWVIQTTNLTYDFGYAEGVGTAIPFCGLAFDPVDQTIWAGAGSGRISDEGDAAIYPEVADENGNPVGNQWSLWHKSIAVNSNENWSKDLRFGNRSSALQIAFVVDATGTSSRVVVATKDGVYLEDAGDVGTWTDILNEQIMAAKFPIEYSHVAAGVGVGKDGVIWALTRKDGYNDPGVFRLPPDLLSGDYDPDDWEEPGANDPALVPPQEGITWFNIVHATGDSDFRTMTVIPGTATSGDEVFVGMPPGADIWVDPQGVQTHNGYFRYGECGDGVTRWVNILYRDGPDVWSDPEVPLAYANYMDPVITKTPIANVGWAVRHSTGSTVPLAVGPDEDPGDGDQYADWMFASMFHCPMVSEFGTGLVGWEQRYTDGMGGMDGYYSTRGLNVMSAYDVGFTTSGSLVASCGDFVGVVTQSGDPTGAGGFRQMAPFPTAGDDSRDLEIVGDEIYMVRQGPTSWAHQVTVWFGYDAPTGAAISRQTHVIALYDENLDDMASPTAGYRWRYISQAFDGDFTEGSYEVVDIEIIDSDMMFAAVTDGSRNVIYRGLRTAMPDQWSWSAWLDTDQDNDLADQQVRRLHHVPDTDELLVASTDSHCLLQLSVSTSSTSGGFTPIVWVDRDSLDGNDRLRMSLKNITNIASDEHGEWLYLTTSGQQAAGFYANGTPIYFGKQSANVLRTPLPADGSPPALDQWDCLVNDGTYAEPIDNIPYAAVDSDYWPDGNGWPGGSSPRAAENLPLIKEIAVHPDNPRRVFIGIRCGGFKAPENFHPNNGVWEYVPDGDGGEWLQRTGDGVGEPCKGIRAVGIVPDVPGASTTLIAGSFGQELFRVDGLAASPLPVQGVTALEAIHAEQTLLMVTLDGAVGDIAEVRVDATSLGLGSRLPFDDDGPTGPSGDWEAGDGIWTANLDGYVAQVFGAQPLPVYVRDQDWNSFYGEVEVEVLAEVPAVYYRNVSPEVGFSYEGTPSGITPTDLRFGGEVDDQRDIYLSQFGDVGKVFRHDGNTEGVPDLLDRTDQRFLYGEAPASDHGPGVSVDLDSDGLLDLIVPAGDNTGPSCLKLYRQDPTDNKFHLQPAWNPLSEQNQAGTWSASCGDYDGDGYVDIYLCRAASQGGLPGEGSGALDDILLRNDLVRSGTFIDAAADIAFGPAIASVAARWCDFDGDGDLDLAVADRATGVGVQIYENGPDTDPLRLRQIYPVDPVEPTWTEDVAEIIWADIDNDSAFELLAQTSDDPAEIYVFEDGAMSVDPVLLTTLPAAASSFRMVDHDLDGDLDILALPAGDAEPPRVLMNDSGAFSIDPSPLGLANLIGAANGALVTDLNGDGAAELFLGRSQDANRFLCTAAEPPTDSWVGVRLLDDSRGNTPAFGARVVFENGVVATVEGDGRSDHTIRIGAGADPDPTCDIYWPSGQVHEDVPLALNDVTTVYHMDDFVTGFGFPFIKGFTELKPGGVVDYIFRWQTTKQTDLTGDSICLDQVPLHLGDPDVTVDQWIDVVGGETVFRHELRWKNRDCVIATLPFTVTAVRGPFSITFANGTVRSRICTPGQDPGDPPGGGL